MDKTCTNTVSCCTRDKKKRKQCARAQPGKCISSHWPSSNKMWSFKELYNLTFWKAKYLRCSVIFYNFSRSPYKIDESIWHQYIFWNSFNVFNISYLLLFKCFYIMKKRFLCLCLESQKVRSCLFWQKCENFQKPKFVFLSGERKTKKERGKQERGNGRNDDWRKKSERRAQLSKENVGKHVCI